MPKSLLINLPSLELEGILRLPHQSQGLVIFSHGAGSSRLSPRNNYVAQVLEKGGIASLLFDLLTPEEDLVYETRFNISLLTERLIAATEWCLQQKEFKKLNFGYFGASTGAASALDAAAKKEFDIKAVVSRGGRPDLATLLKKVDSPTLLLVGELDEDVIELNKSAYQQLAAKDKKLEIIAGAGHLFEEEETLAKVAKLAKNWFKKYL